jgi:hypothetical protein
MADAVASRSSVLERRHGATTIDAIEETMRTRVSLSLARARSVRMRDVVVCGARSGDARHAVVWGK